MASGVHSLWWKNISTENDREWDFLGQVGNIHKKLMLTEVAALSATQADRFFCGTQLVITVVLNAWDYLGIAVRRIYKIPWKGFSGKLGLMPLVCRAQVRKIGKFKEIILRFFHIGNIFSTNQIEIRQFSLFAVSYSQYTTDARIDVSSARPRLKLKSSAYRTLGNL